jgi:hypothetical protein
MCTMPWKVGVALKCAPLVIQGHIKMYLQGELPGLTFESLVCARGCDRSRRSMGCSRESFRLS